MTPYDWQTDAICAQTDPDLFFSPDPQEIEAAINLCGTCPVIKQCAELRKKKTTGTAYGPVNTTPTPTHPAHPKNGG